MEFRKRVTITLCTRQQKRHRYIEQSFGLCGRGRGQDGLGDGIETCIISYKKQIASPGLMQDTGCLGLVHWDDPEGWYGEGGGRGAQDWEHVYTRDRFMLVYCKTNTILKEEEERKKVTRIIKKQQQLQKIYIYGVCFKNRVFFFFS